MMDDLPVEIILIISAYLNYKELRCLSHSNKALREELNRNNLIKFKLNWDYSSYFISNTKDFRTKNLNKIIKIYLSFGDFESIECLRGIEEVSLCECHKVKDFSPLGESERVLINYCDGIKDCSALHEVKYLNLIGCSNIMDVSMLGGCYSLSIYCHPRCVGFHKLGAVKELLLSGCDLLNNDDISSLMFVKVLTLRNCKGVTDVSCLGTVESLAIEGCKGVTNVRNLHTVPKLKIDSCYEIIEWGIMTAPRIDFSNKKLIWSAKYELGFLQ